MQALNDRLNPEKLAEATPLDKPIPANHLNQSQSNRTTPGPSAENQLIDTKLVSFQWNFEAMTLKHSSTIAQPDFLKTKFNILFQKQILEQSIRT